MVTGGYTHTGGHGWDYLDTTELLLPSAFYWSVSAALPSPLYLLRGATLDNKVVITGTNMDMYTLIIICHNLFYVTFHYTTQGALAALEHWMKCWNLTRRDKNGTRLGP